MKRSALLWIVVLAILLVLITCLCVTVTGVAGFFLYKEVSKPFDFELNADNFPRLNGSTSTIPLSNLIACRASGVFCTWSPDLDNVYSFGPLKHDSTFPDLRFSGTHGSYESLIEGESDVILVARKPSQDEIALARQTGVTLEVVPIALDAFVFIANTENPVESLSQAQILAIYTGKITNWKEVGGKDEPIKPFQRDKNSGSQELMDEMVLKGEAPIDSPLLIDNTMVAIFHSVEGSPNGIGYSVYYYEKNMARRPHVKVLGVDGVIPSSITIRSRQYPFVTEVYAVIRSDLDRDSTAYQLFAWLQTDAGQKLVQQSGYVPVNP